MYSNLTRANSKADGNSEVQSRVKIRSFHLAPIFENDFNFGGSQSNWRHFEIFGDGLKNKMFDHFLIL